MLIGNLILLVMTTVNRSATFPVNFNPSRWSGPRSLKRLFGHPDLSTTQRNICARIALPQLAKMGTATEASHLLRGCLRDRALDEESARLVVQCGLTWIRSNPHDEGADFIFNRLLRRHDLLADSWTEISGIAIAWLHDHTNPDNRDLSLAALLMRPEHLAKHDLDWVLQSADEWLANLPKGAHPPHKLQNALARARPNRGELGIGLNDPGWIDKKVTERLRLAALGRAAVPQLPELEEIIKRMTAALDTSRPGSAAYPLACMLVIIQPTTQPELWSNLIKLAQRILADPGYLPQQRNGLARTVWLYVDRGRWPEEFARPVLYDLNLPRPGETTLAMAITATQ